MPKKLFALSLLLMLCIAKTAAQDLPASVIKYNLTQQEYQKTYDELSEKYALADISIITVNNQNRFSCIWHRQSNGVYRREWKSHYNLSLDEFIATNDKIIRENGLVPFSVTPYLTPKKEVKYAAIWQKYMTNDVINYTNLDVSYFPTLCNLLKEEKYLNFMPSSLVFYEDEAGNNKFSAFGVNTGYTTDADLSNLDSETFNDYLARAKEQEWMLDYISVAVIDGKLNYATIWSADKALFEWEVTDGLTQAQLEKTIKEKEAAGYYPSALKAYELNKEVKYLMLWLNPPW